MRSYSVIFSEEAETDLIASVQWGIDNWGEEITWKWYFRIKDKIESSLSTIPLAHPRAGENDEYQSEVRQMFVGRYRVLFNIAGKTVRILHVRGPFTGEV